MAQLSPDGEEGGFPASLPFTELWLTVVEGQWPVRADINEHHAITTVQTKQAENRSYRVRIWKVTAIEVEELQLQQEVVRQSLVPYGTAVDS